MKNNWMLFSTSLALSLCVLSAPRVRATMVFTPSGSIFNTGSVQVVPSSFGSPASQSFSGNIVNVASVLNKFPGNTNGNSYLNFAPQSFSSGYTAGAAAGSTFFDGVSQFNLDPNFYMNCPLVSFDMGSDWGDTGDGSMGWTESNPVVGIGTCGSGSSLGQVNSIIPALAVNNNRMTFKTSVAVPDTTPVQIVHVLKAPNVVAPQAASQSSTPVDWSKQGAIAF
jgi:hypothetical protein